LQLKEKQAALAQQSAEAEEKLKAASAIQVSLYMVGYWASNT
jgi:hypothetical protein